MPLAFSSSRRFIRSRAGRVSVVILLFLWLVGVPPRGRRLFFVAFLPVSSFHYAGLLAVREFTPFIVGVVYPISEFFDLQVHVAVIVVSKGSRAWDVALACFESFYFRRDLFLGSFRHWSILHH